MYALIMWVGLFVFFAALCLASVVNTQKRSLQKAGRQPDARDRRLDRVARILFIIGIVVWIIGALILAGKNG